MQMIIESFHNTPILLIAIPLNVTLTLVWKNWKNILIIDDPSFILSFIL